MKKKSRRSAKKSAKKPATKRSRRKTSTASTRSHTPTRGLYGWITHTELASANPAATKVWCAKVLGWTFRPSVPMPGGGEYMLFAYSDEGGGGIRPTMPSETPGSSFTVHVADARAAFEKALREGAEAIQPPTPIMPGVTIAVVREPGGVRVGFSGP
jgi:predicted enzyme related to lactoylglutathione lyase